MIRVFSAPPQSEDGKPGAARFAGLRAINGFLVSSERLVEPADRPMVRFIGIQSLAGADCKVALPAGWDRAVAERADPQTCKALGTVPATVQDGVIRFATEAGQTYLLYPSGQRLEQLWSDAWDHRPFRPRKYIGLPEASTAQ